MRRAGLAVGAPWVCWWVFFETAEAFSDHEFGQAVIFAVMMLGTVASAWRWPVVGATLFVAEGLTSFVLFTPMWWDRFHLAGMLLSRRSGHAGHPAHA